MSVKLIQAGDFVTREFPIAVDDFTIGRDYTCDLRLDHGRISRNHCRILKRGKRVLVEALYSTAGTAINQKILDPAHPPIEVHDGDHLWVGPEHFQFAIALDAGDSGTPASGPKNGDAEPPENPLLKDVMTVQSRAAHKLLEKLSGPAGVGEEPQTPEPVVAPEPQGTVDVTHMDGVALVRLLPRTIVADSDIRSIAEELDELIETGQNCITLHLGNVERLSSQVIGEVFQIYKRCKAKGGMLKICKVSPEVAGVFAMTNMQRHIEIFPDEKLALKSIWPRQAPSIPKAPVDWPRPDQRKAAAVATPSAPSKGVQLIVEVGRAKGRAVDIRTPSFLIGRDQQCQLRPNSNAISRLHTAIEQREGRVYVRDLGSQVGTILNGRVLRDEEAEVFHGDRLEIDVLQFTFAIENRADSTATGHQDETLSTLLGEQKTDSSADTTIMALPDLGAMPSRPAASHPADPLDPMKPRRLGHLTCDFVREITVVTLLVPDLSEESNLAAVRVELETIMEQPGQDRIIIRFDRVKTLNRGSVVMFLARAQHLVRTKGTMRFCGVSPPILEFLEKTQLPLLIEIYPTIEEAMNTPWK